MEIRLPEKVKQIIHRITQAGYEAYAVGGCIRDSILGRVPDDWDITTSATPQQVKALFTRTIDTGIQHGTVTVMLDKEGFEVTTYRIDGKYEDGRHPTEVIFTPSLEEDLKRRDFTMNAMAYNDQDGLVDLFGGIRDMEAGVIRCVGNARARFGEDALRIMRAIRFAAQLGYRIEEETFAAIRELAPTLCKISAERIQVELTKLVTSPHPETMRVVYETGVAAVILPEFARAMETCSGDHRISAGEHSLAVMQLVSKTRALRLAALFICVGNGDNELTAELTRKILRRLRYDNDTIQNVCRLVLYHGYGAEAELNACTVRRAVSRIGEDLFPQFLELKKAHILAQPENERIEQPERLALWNDLYAHILERGECVSLKTLAVTGSDLIALGMKPGKELGETLKELLELVLEHPEYNTREYLCWMVRDKDK